MHFTDRGGGRGEERPPPQTLALKQLGRCDLDHQGLFLFHIRTLFSSWSLLFHFSFSWERKEKPFWGERLARACLSVWAGVRCGWGGDPFLPGKEREGGVVPAASLHPVHALCDFLQRYPTAPPRFSELGVFIDY